MTRRKGVFKAQHVTKESDLPHSIQPGDRVRFKTGCTHAYLRAYEFDKERVFTVTYGPDFEGRFKVDGAPHLVWPHDVELCWSSDDERRTALRAAAGVTP